MGAAEKRQLLLAGEDKKPLGIFTQKKLLRDALYSDSELTESAFSEKYTLYLKEKEVPFTYGRMCQALRDVDRGQKLLIYDKDDQPVYRIWSLPVNPSLKVEIPTVTRVVLG